MRRVKLRDFSYFKPRARFASRVVNNHEINDSVTEKELLAVVFGERVHRCFQYVRSFKVITDHAALKWLIKVKNHQCARFNRWALKLSEYDFEIQHRPGSKHINVDVLSRHVAAVVQNDQVPEGSVGEKETEARVFLSKQVIGQAKWEDEFCKKKKK